MPLLWQDCQYLISLWTPLTSPPACTCHLLVLCLLINASDKVKVLSVFFSFLYFKNSFFLSMSVRIGNRCWKNFSDLSKVKKGFFFVLFFLFSLIRCLFYYFTEKIPQGIWSPARGFNLSGNCGLAKMHQVNMLSAMWIQGHTSFQCGENLV